MPGWSKTVTRIWKCWHFTSPIERVPHRCVWLQSGLGLDGQIAGNRRKKPGCVQGWQLPFLKISRASNRFGSFKNHTCWCRYEGVYLYVARYGTCQEPVRAPLLVLSAYDVYGQQRSIGFYLENVNRDLRTWTGISPNIGAQTRTDNHTLCSAGWQAQLHPQNASIHSPKCSLAAADHNYPSYYFNPQLHRRLCGYSHVMCTRN